MTYERLTECWQNLILFDDPSSERIIITPERHLDPLKCCNQAQLSTLDNLKS